MPSDCCSHQYYSLHVYKTSLFTYIPQKISYLVTTKIYNLLIFYKYYYFLTYHKNLLIRPTKLIVMFDWSNPTDPSTVPNQKYLSGSSKKIYIWFLFFWGVFCCCKKRVFFHIFPRKNNCQSTYSNYKFATIIF